MAGAKSPYGEDLLLVPEWMKTRGGFYFSLPNRFFFHAITGLIQNIDFLII